MISKHHDTNRLDSWYSYLKPLSSQTRQHLIASKMAHLGLMQAALGCMTEANKVNVVRCCVWCTLMRIL